MKHGVILNEALVRVDVGLAAEKCDMSGWSGWMDAGYMELGLA